MSTPRGRAAAQVAVDQERVASAVKTYHLMTTRFATLCGKRADPVIYEDARLNAVAAFEALLDAIRNERDALTILDAVRNNDPRFARRNPKDWGGSTAPPKDDA